MADKAQSRDKLGRFREIVSDPLNLLIRRVEDAGQVKDGLVCLHNGHWVPMRGEFSYYSTFSDILVINRGVHEPLEEFVFQEMIPHLPEQPVMLELGAYWAHYSMWMKKERPNGRAFMVEPDEKSIKVGQENFARHGYDGVFEQGFVGPDQVTVDDFMSRHGIDRLNILHSDIQGYETAMLDGAKLALDDKRVDHVFVSTHSDKLHRSVVRGLRERGYRIDVNANVSTETTSFDGFVLAMRPDLPSFVPSYRIMGRQAICKNTPEAVVAYVWRMTRALAALRGCAQPDA